MAKENNTYYVNRQKIDQKMKKSGDENCIDASDSESWLIFQRFSRYLNNLPDPHFFAPDQNSKNRRTFSCNFMINRYKMLHVSKNYKRKHVRKKSYRKENA